MRSNSDSRISAPKILGTPVWTTVVFSISPSQAPLQRQPPFCLITLDDALTTVGAFELSKSMADALFPKPAHLTNLSLSFAGEENEHKLFKPPTRPTRNKQVLLLNLPAETTTSVRLEACTVHGNLRVYSERSPLKGWTVLTRHWELPNICKSGRGFPIPIFDYRRVTTITPDKLWLVKPLFLGKVPINRFVETLTDCLGFIISHHW